VDNFCQPYIKQIPKPAFHTLQGNPIYVFLFWELPGLSPDFHVHVLVSDLYIPRIGPYFSCSRIGRNIYISHRYECRNTWNRETEHYNSVLEIITVSFLGINKREPDIHVGFSPALHLQCTQYSSTFSVKQGLRVLASIAAAFAFLSITTVSVLANFQLKVIPIRFHIKFVYLHL
jgi:hypothetical protein